MRLHCPVVLYRRQDADSHVQYDAEGHHHLVIVNLECGVDIPLAGIEVGLVDHVVQVIRGEDILEVLYGGPESMRGWVLKLGQWWVGHILLLPLPWRLVLLRSLTFLAGLSISLFILTVTGVLLRHLLWPDPGDSTCGQQENKDKYKGK